MRSPAASTERSSGPASPVVHPSRSPNGASSAMRAVVVFELTLAFVVYCADRAGEDEERPHRRMPARVVRGVFWMITLTRWLTHRNLASLGRFATIVWLLVTSGWLITMIHDRASSTGVFL